MQRKLTPEMLSEARALRAEDGRLWTYQRLADRYGVSTPAMHHALNRAARRNYERARRSERNVAMHEVAEANRAAERGQGCEHATTRVAALARLKEIPADTRDFTQRFFDDPLPGRSALDQKRRIENERKADG